MKKALFLILGIMLVACNKHDGLTQDVTFGYTLVEEYSMTKAINHASVKDVITTALPKTIKPAFYFNNDETQGQNISMGQSVTMKVGTYGVRWNNSPNNIANVINGNTFFAKTPQLNIDTEISIVPGTSEYTIPVTFKSFAIVVDATEIQKAEYFTMASAYSDIDFFIEAGDSRIIFINGEFTDNGILKLCLIPSDDSRKATYFNLSNKVSSTSQAEIVHVDYGKYYVLHPEAVTEVGSVFNLNIPEWEWGNEED